MDVGPESHEDISDIEVLLADRGIGSSSDDSDGDWKKPSVWWW